MRFKKDHMKNAQLLPGYNLQLAICDEYIAHYGVFAFASDMDCFQPLIDGFFKRYKKYPRYPLADAGYGRFNNNLYCELHNMEKVMKFTMYEKETKDAKYRDNPYRACNVRYRQRGIHDLSQQQTVPLSEIRAGERKPVRQNGRIQPLRGLH